METFRRYAVLVGVLLATVVLSGALAFKIVWLIFASGTIVVGWILWGLGSVMFETTPDHKLYKQAQNRLGEQGRFTYLYEYLFLLEDLRALHVQMSVGSIEAEIVGLDIKFLVADHQDAAMRGMPYAPPRAVEQAARTLGLDGPHTPKGEIAAAAAEKRRPYDLEAIKQRRAPKKALKTAQQRLANIDAAERLLRHMPASKSRI